MSSSLNSTFVLLPLFFSLRCIRLSFAFPKLVSLFAFRASRPPRSLFRPLLLFLGMHPSFHRYLSLLELHLSLLYRLCEKKI